MEKVVSKTQVLPALSSVLIEAKGNKLFLTTTDLEIAIKWEGLAKVEKEGICSVPVKVFGDLVSHIKNSHLSLELKENNLVVECEDLKSSLRTLEHTEFPAIPDFSPDLEVLLRAQDLVSGLQAVSSFVSPLNVRPELSAVFLRVKNEDLVFVATDSFRLGEKRVSLDKSYNQKEVLLPSKTVGVLSSAFSKAGMVKVEFDEHLIGFRSQDEINESSFWILSKLTEGEFPEYERFVPKDFTTEAYILKEEFIEKLRACSVFAPRSNEITLYLDPAKKVIELKTESTDKGSFEVKIPSKIEGQEFKVLFDWRYLLEGSSKIEDNELFLGLTGKEGEEGPALIKPVSEEERFLYVLMPIQGVS